MVYQSAIDALLAQARAVLDRVEPEDLDDELAAGAVLIDIRPVGQRQRDGELTGAIIIDRNVLEWRLDPTSPDRLPVASSSRNSLHPGVQPGLQLKPRRRHAA
jgi:hypothetical protein